MLFWKLTNKNPRCIYDVNIEPDVHSARLAVLYGVSFSAIHLEFNRYYVE